MIEGHHDDLRVQGALELIRQPKSDAPDGLEGSLLCLRLSKRDDMGASFDAVQQAPQIVLHRVQSSSLELLRQQESDGGATLSSKHQKAALHSLDAALLLIPSPLEPAVDRNNLSDREPLWLEDPLGAGPFFPRVQLGDPHSDRAVSSPEPLECRIGKEVWRDCRADRSCGAAASGEPAEKSACADGEDENERLRSYRSHPRRRNQM